MFRKGLSRLVTLLPDLKIGVNVAPAILPLSSVVTQARRDHSSGAAEDASKHMGRDVRAASLGRRSFHRPES